jgi:hypothetical protein
VQGSERQRATSAPEPRGQPLAIGCRPEQGSLPLRVGNKVSVFRRLLAAEAEQGRARKAPLAPAVFENPTGFRVEGAWGQEVAVRFPADPTPGAEKTRPFLRRRTRAETVGFVGGVGVAIAAAPRGLHFQPRARGATVGFVCCEGSAMPTAPAGRRR